MLCEHCHKNEAQITYTTVEGDTTKELHICRSCFQDLIKEDFPSMQIPSVEIQPLLKELFPLFGYGDRKDEERACAHCNRTLREFQETGILGCEHCYEAFSEELSRILPRIQGAKKHVGHKPRAALLRDEKSRKIQTLQEELERAVAEERYEDAADRRDRIKELREDKDAQ